MLAKFPGAEIVDVRPPAGAAPTSSEEMPPAAEPDGEAADDEV
jgi:hypothetical protein